jgi:hypothetical protein
VGSGAADREAVEQQGRRDVLRLTKGQSIKFAYSSGVTGNIGPSSLRLASGGSTGFSRRQSRRSGGAAQESKRRRDADRADVYPDVGRPSTFLKEPRLRAVMWDFSRKGETPGRANLNCKLQMLLVQRAQHIVSPLGEDCDLRR